ncbi:MAG: heavy-metal-associated domain-containing protein [Anaerococcus vaginalis]|nr:heavy-metal-associated domain-containing protein [Anaerococcus vaginalis]
MKKTYKIDVDCPACANKMEIEAKNTDGVKDCSINFMMLKMKVTFEDDVDQNEVMKNVLENCKKIEKDCEIYF